MIDLTPALLKAQAPKERKFARYNVSELWAIANHYLTPQTYLKTKNLAFYEAFRMWSGSWKHQMVQSLLTEEPWMLEIKKELDLEDIVLVGKVDAINEDTILEIKTTDHVLKEAKPWHVYQLKCYLTMFERSKGFVVQPVHTKNKLYLKELAEVLREDSWFQDQLSLLKDFHKKVESI